MINSSVIISDNCNMDNEESRESDLDFCLGIRYSDSLRDSNLILFEAKVTNPLNGDIDEDLLRRASEAINERSDGPQIALRFLAHKIQSPQEIEALHSLNVRSYLWLNKLNFCFV